MKKLLSILSIVLIFVSVLSLMFSLPKKSDNDDINNNDDIVVTSVDFTTMNYVALGDSITNGSYNKDRPYPYVVGDIMEFNKVLNYGIGRSTLSNCTADCNIDHTTPMVSRFDEMIDNADIVSVMGGINDWLFNHEMGTIDSVEDSTIYGALKILCQGLKEKYPNAFIFFMTPYKTNIVKGVTEFHVVDLANTIKEVCSIYNIPVLDLHDNGNFNPDTNSWNNDGLHPNQEFFNTHTAPQIVQFIKDNYKK